MEFMKLHRGRAQAAEEIWAALSDRAEPQLLTRALTEAAEHPTATADEIADAAAAFHDASNAARSASLRSSGAQSSATSADEEVRTEIPSATTGACRTAIGQLLDQLRAGAELSRYDHGSLRLLIVELDAYLTPATESDAA